MSANLQKLPTRTDDGSFRVVVESPRGSTVKLKYDPKNGIFEVSRPLVLGLTYPYDWGFIPSTEADDGDPLDVMLLWENSTAPGVVVPARALGMVKLEQNGKKKQPKRVRNDRVIAVPVASARGADMHDLGDISSRVRAELERFFIAATGFTQKEPKVLGWGDARDAERLVEQTRIKRR